jgi:hypothetical protein
VRAQERDRVQHRTKGYYFMNNLLKKRTSPNAGKIDRVAPPPNERVNLIRAVHIEVGDFGVHKTHSLLKPTYFCPMVCLRRSAMKCRLARCVIV